MTSLLPVKSFGRWMPNLWTGLQSCRRRCCFSARSCDQLIECKMQSAKYEMQNGGLNSFCISYFALCIFVVASLRYELQAGFQVLLEPFDV